MARVTKINVGGTNYDIAHEGELKNSGFEVVTELPTTGLFEGRQVLYQNRVWVYSNGWESPYNPVSFPTGVTLQSSTESLTAATRYVELMNNQLGQIPDLLNKALFISNNKNCVKQSDRLYELIDNETGTITVKPNIVQPVLGQTLRYTAINPSYDIDELYNRIFENGMMQYSVYSIFIPQNVRFEKAIYKIEYYIYTDATGDRDVNNRDNYEWKTVFEKELNQYTEIIYPLTATVSIKLSYVYAYMHVYNVRVSVSPTTKNRPYDIVIRDIDIKYFGIENPSLIDANRLINYDAVIEPTQTGEEFKSIPWILQYLTQSVNWLKANKPELYEANLLWGGRNIMNSFSPTDAGMMSELSANVMAFPNPAGILVEYSRDGGVTWLDYEATDEQKVDLFITSSFLYCGKSYPDGLLATVGYQLRITITPIECGLYTNLNKIIMNISTNAAENCWCTFSGLKAREVAVGNEDDTYYDTFVNKAKIAGWPGYNVLNFNSIRTAMDTTSTSQANNYYRLRLIFGYDKTISLPRPGFYIAQLRFFGDGRYKLPSNLAMYNHLYTYDWQQNALFPAKVESKEIINFDVNNIEPTQTGSSVSKTSTWLWQYLVQAVNWLKANNVRLSAYNTKVAALEQADSDNNASIQSVSTDLTELSNGLATVARSGSYNDLTDKPTLFSGSYNDLTDKPTLAAVATSGSYNDLTDKPSFSGSYNDLTDKPTIPSSLEDLGGSVTTAQITDGSITNAKLANSSMSLNGTTVNLGDTAILPWYIDYNEVDYPARIREHWLQIYRNGVWANLMYLGDILPTQVAQITSLDNLDWYNEQVSEYEVDSNTTTSILNGTTLPATVLMNCLAERLTINLYPISGKQYGKGSLDSLITDLQGKGFAVFVENDLDAIIGSGSDYLVRLKISKVPTAKAIIECYVAR